MLIVSPPLLIVYFCLSYTVLFSTQSTFSVYEQVMSSLELLLAGIVTGTVGTTITSQYGGTPLLQTQLGPK